MKRIIAHVLFLSALLVGFAANTDPADASSSGDIPSISIEELKDKLGEPSVVILDVRIGKDIAASRFKVKGAIWVNPKEIGQWVHSLPSKSRLQTAPTINSSKYESAKFLQGGR